jgi:hypothetical protein
MHFHHFPFAMIAGLAMAAASDVLGVLEASPGALSLTKRQDASHAFRPNPARTRQGTDCAATFGAGYLLCNPSAFLSKLCYNPALGQSCCEESCKFSARYLNQTIHKQGSRFLLCERDPPTHIFITFAGAALLPEIV